MEIVKPIKLVRKITREQLSQILKRHKLWLTGYPQGMRADLSHMDLSGFDLRRVNLCSADLDGADLSYADLRGANLDAVRLGNVNLEGAKLDDYFISLRLSQNNEHMLVYNVTKNIIWYDRFKGSLEEFDARRNELMQADSEIDKQDCLSTVAYLETVYKLHKSFDVKPVRVIKRIKIGK